jgi:hypothetical protein
MVTSVLPRQYHYADPLRSSFDFSGRKEILIPASHYSSGRTRDAAISDVQPWLVEGQQALTRLFRHFGRCASDFVINAY